MNKERFRTFSLSSLLVLTILLGWSTLSARAQIGGNGAISGTIIDSTGAVVSDATVIAREVATGTIVTRSSSSSGYYMVSPLKPGVYTLEVTAKGFQRYIGENITVDALAVVGVNVHLNIGQETETITVTDAPPAIQTENATLGATIENATYSELPLTMNGLQRDPTAFATLSPGAQAGSRGANFLGTGSYLSEIYFEGIPLGSSGTQSDNRSVSYSVSVDAVDQIQVQTAGSSVQYQGAGFSNFTIKSGTNKFHGTVYDFLRNTAFDTWGFTAPAATQKNAAGATVAAPKPSEHQNEFGFALGGPILRDKLFFFGQYTKFHYTAGVRPGTLTIPTAAMRTGDFSAISQPIYDPTTQTACTANSTTGACRYQFGYMAGSGAGPAGNPILSGASVNVIPSSQLSPISTYMAKFLPDPTNNSITSNYLGGVPNGTNNFQFTGRIDYNLTPSQRFSVVYSQGQRAFIGLDVGATTTLPLPYSNGIYYTSNMNATALEHSWAISDHLINQVKLGYTRGWGPIKSPSDGVAKYESSTAGITGLEGQAATTFPGVSFSGTNGPDTWTKNTSYTAVGQSWDFVDNVQYMKGKHALTFGGQMQWLNGNGDSFDTSESTFTLAYSYAETSNFVSNSSTYNTSTGAPYASYLMGAVNSTGITKQSFAALGGRYRPAAVYLQDDFKVLPNLTVNAGLRWDFMPPLHEVLDRWSYLDPTVVNPATGNPGALRFVGQGADACNCRTPVHTYHGYFGPRVGVAWAVKPKVVVRSSYALMYTHGGGIGGRAANTGGTGQLGFTSSPSFIDSTAGPSFYLNNSTGFQTLGLSNTNFGGSGYSIPDPVGRSYSAATLNTGNYVDSTGAYVSASAAPGYPDPVISGRGPQFNFWNLGVQRELTNDLSISVDYVGSESHFLPGSARGKWLNQLDPKYLQLGSLLPKQATAANIAAAKAVMSGVAAPYQGYANAGAVSAKATIVQMLLAFPQYSSVADTWGNVSNSNYNSLQVVLHQRPAHGLSFTLNYTYSREIDDTGTFRSGYDIPSTAISSGKAWKQDRADRSVGTADQPQVVTAYGSYDLPFGKGHIGRNNRLIRDLSSDWSFSGIFTYYSGTPLAVTASNCTTSGQGTCMPNYTSGYSHSPRKNGKWGHGVTAATISSVSYVDSSAFTTPSAYMIGDVARTRPYDLRAPSAYNINAGLHRTFPLWDDIKLNFRAECFNVTNSVVFGGIGVVSNNSAFGTVSTQSNASRDWQFAARVSF
jgi:hypothetical protein